jgi:hypothetical protein
MKRFTPIGFFILARIRGGSCVESAIGALISRERATPLFFFGEVELQFRLFLKKALISSDAQSASSSSILHEQG